MKKFVLASVVCAPLFAASTLKISPAPVELRGPEARQQLLAEATVDNFHEDWTRLATWSSSDPGVVAVDASGVLKPVADGSATITAKRNGITATVPVQVKDAKAPFTWSFRNHVMPVLTKAGSTRVLATERWRARTVSNLRCAAMTPSWITTY